MPIFSFQIAVGFRHTKSKLKYILRMFILALISEPISRFMMSSANYVASTLNICFSYTVSLLILYFIDLSKKNKIYIIPSLILIVRKCVFAS